MGDGSIASDQCQETPTTNDIETIHLQLQLVPMKIEGGFDVTKEQPLPAVEVLRRALAAASAKGKSLSEIARQAGLFPASVTRFVAGTRDLTFVNAAKLCQVLGLKLVKGRG